MSDQPTQPPRCPTHKTYTIVTGVKASAPHGPEKKCVSDSWKVVQ